MQCNLQSAGLFYPNHPIYNMEKLIQLENYDLGCKKIYEATEYCLHKALKYWGCFTMKWDLGISFEHG